MYLSLFLSVLPHMPLIVHPFLLLFKLSIIGFSFPHWALILKMAQLMTLVDSTVALLKFVLPLPRPHPLEGVRPLKNVLPLDPKRSSTFKACSSSAKSSLQNFCSCTTNELCNSSINMLSVSYDSSIETTT